MKIEALTVSVNYSDFLVWTLPRAKTLFDNLVVVTSKQDTKTKAVCDYHHVNCIQTDVFYEGDSEKRTFNKGRGINEGLKQLNKDAWLVHFDADIFFPRDFKRIMNSLLLDEKCLYGADRYMCTSFQDFMQYLCTEPFDRSSWILDLQGLKFPIGSRLTYGYSNGWCPLGYFQMWHPAGSKIYSYPEEHKGADGSDIQFACNWPKNKRILFPNFVVTHIENEASPLGANWNGRSTKIFKQI